MACQFPFLATQYSVCIQNADVRRPSVVELVLEKDKGTFYDHGLDMKHIHNPNQVALVWAIDW